MLALSAGRPLFAGFVTLALGTGFAFAEDHDGIPVFLARNAWDLRTTMQEYPAIRFKETREQS